MRRVQFTMRMLAATLVTTALLGLLLLAWGLRPSLPHLGQSPTGPSATATAEQIVAVIAWALALILILRLLSRVAQSTMRSRPAASKSTQVRIQRMLVPQSADRGRRMLVHQATVKPYQLIVRRPDEPGPIAEKKASDPPVSASPDDGSTTRSVSVLGPLAIQGAAQRGRRLRSLTAELLTYLALHPEGATVEQLIDTLLPDTEPKRARNRLWQSAAEARRVLDDGFRREDHGRYQLDRGAVHIDLDVMERLLKTAGDAGTRDAEAEHLEQALQQFRGEPLADVDWLWAEGHTRHLRATYVDLLERVGRIRLEYDDARGALSLAERGLEIDRLNEALSRLAMEAEFAVGLRDSVSRRYARLRDLLDRELGLEPAGETRGLYHTLLGQS